MKGIILIAILGTLISCGEKVLEKPENLIPKEQMVEILYDLAIINAAKNTNPDYLTNRNIESMPFIYQQYGIDSLQFVMSDAYYASIPEEYEALYKIVEARLEEEKSEFDKNKARVSDSIRKIAEEQRKKIKKRSATKKVQDSIP